MTSPDADAAPAPYVFGARGLRSVPGGVDADGGDAAGIENADLFALVAAGSPVPPPPAYRRRKAHGEV